jgi:hypothetical protein
MIRILTEEVLKREAKRGFERFSSFLHSIECYTTQDAKCSTIVDDFVVSSEEGKREIWEGLCPPDSK